MDDQLALLDLGGDDPEPAAPEPRRTSAGIAAGDVVEVDRKGRRFHALVEEVEQAGAGRVHQLVLRPLDGRTTYRRCSAREVVAAWRRAPL